MTPTPSGAERPERREAVLDVLALVSGRPRAEIRPEMDLVADLGLDSPKAVRLLVELEERLGAEIDDSEAAGVSTVADLLRLADAHA